QFGKRIALARHLGYGHRKLGVATRAFEREDARAGFDAIAFMHGNVDDALGSGRGQRDAVVLERAQRLRCMRLAGRKCEQETGDAGPTEVMRHAGSSSPRSSRASAWLRMCSTSSSALAKS